MRTLYLFLLWSSVCSVFALDNYPELITDRPDQTESSVVVPHKSLQIETGFVQENKETSIVNEKAFGYNSTLLRYGLLANFELRLGLEYLAYEIESKHTTFSERASGISPLYTGFKVEVAEEDGWRPDVAFLGGMVLPFTAAKEFKTEYSAGDMRFSFSHTLSQRFSVGYNVGVEWDGETAVPGYFYSAVLGVQITDQLGGFVESFGLMPEKGDEEHLLDAGLTYLLSPNFQLDISGGLGLSDNAIDNFISFGFTYRLLN